MEKKSLEETEQRFTELIQKAPYPVPEMLGLIAEVPSGKGEEWAAALFTALVEDGDLEGLFTLLKERGDVVERKLKATGVRDGLRKATKDRLVQAFVDSVGFGVRPLKESLGRLQLLIGFQPGARVLNAAWGLGEVKRVDGFYRRVTVDFRTRKGHQLTFDAACETLKLAPDDHILVIARADPARIEKMLKENPGDFVKEMLQSFGDMPLTRLEELSAQNGFVKPANWKAFWERARVDLRKDKLVDIPTRRAEPLHLKAGAETYGDSWFTAFTSITDPKSILSSIRELQGTERFKTLDDAARAKIAERLAYALKGSRGVDDALYARVAFCLDELKLNEELVAKARVYLWEYDRYIRAARTLPARETGSLVRFLTASDPATTKHTLFAKLPEMCFALLSETLTAFAQDADCEAAVSKLLKQPGAPATLVTFILGRWQQFSHWTQLPPLVVILTHAIALGEGRQGGETLRMQNVIRRLFADSKWLEGIFKQLQPADQALFFERFQASIAWDPSTHHMIVVRMTRIVPELASRQVKPVEVKKIERITSLRSYAARKAAFEHLVNVEIPENAKAIEFARGYGDLSENFEYQSAKDQERVLLQKQTVLQADLDAVSPVDFLAVQPDEVRPGTTVTLKTAAGETKTYTILGEWDNDLERNIISNKTRLAANMLGKKPGDAFELPDAEGHVSEATIVSVASLSDELRAWVKGPAEAAL